MKSLKKIVIAASAFLMIPAALSAQWAMGPHLVFSKPQDEFASITKLGVGLGLKAHYELPSIEFVSVRCDFSYISYDSKPGGGYYVTRSERNEAYRLIFGPQLAFNIDRFMLYSSAMAGIYNFRMVRTVSDYTGYYGYSDTLSSRTKMGWSIGGGILIDIGLGPWIDLELKYHTINDIIVDEVDGVEIESDGNDISVNIGVVFFLK